MSFGEDWGTPSEWVDVTDRVTGSTVFRGRVEGWPPDYLPEEDE